MASLRKNNTNTIGTYLEGTLSASCYKISISLISYPNKNFTRKENYRPISLRNIGTKILYDELAKNRLETINIT